MKYKVGDLVEFNCLHFKGLGKIVETEIGKLKDHVLIKLPDEFKGQGHDGNEYSKKRYSTNDYWFIENEEILRKVERKMKLSDLKAGKHVIEIRSGEKFLVAENKNGVIFGICLNGRNYFSALYSTGYDDNLTFLNSYKNNDIVKIYEIENSCTFEYLENNLSLIWEHKEVKKMTKAMIESELGYEVEIVEEK